MKNFLVLPYFLRKVFAHRDRYMEKYGEDGRDNIAKYGYATGYTLMGQAVAVPALNLLAMRNQGKTYGQGLKTIKGDLSKLYIALPENSMRRICSSIPIATFSNKLDIDPIQKAVFNSTVEATLSLLFGEMSEKSKMIKQAINNSGGVFDNEGALRNMRNGSLAGAIFVRNFLFTSAIFLTDPIAARVFSSQMNQNLNFSLSEITASVRFACGMACVIPDNIANNLASGKKLADLFKDNEITKNLLKGAIARGVYSSVATWAVVTGFQVAELKKEIGDFHIDELVDISLYKLYELIPLHDVLSEIKEKAVEKQKDFNLWENIPDYAEDYYTDCSKEISLDSWQEKLRNTGSDKNIKR